MNCTNILNNNQVVFNLNCETEVGNLIISSELKNFKQSNIAILKNDNKFNYNFIGKIISDEEVKCDNCNTKVHVNNTITNTLKHLPLGEYYTLITVSKIQYVCPKCGKTFLNDIPFKSENHNITKELEIYIRDLLATNKFTNKDIAFLTGVNRNIIKEIDKKRLIELYTEDEKLKKPEKQSKYLGIDEFKLHDGYKYATHIIDLETGHILWIQEGKKKQVVYDFIEHVGIEWMSNVIAIACDMNSDFEEAFKEKCPHLKIVYDHFHIIKNFNDKVISNIRKDEQKRLELEGRTEEAKKFKNSRFILTSKMENLEKKDKEANKNKVIKKGSNLFKTNNVIRTGGKIDKYIKLINENELLLTCELIKELLSEAYKSKNEEEMAELIFEIMELCENSKNKHLLWFLKLLYNHFDGIITHATYKISSGKIEGINNKIKTIRRQHYGLPDDEYFFLKTIDASRH